MTKAVVDIVGRDIIVRRQRKMKIVDVISNWQELSLQSSIPEVKEDGVDI